jgi:hypothetical protein
MNTRIPTTALTVLLFVGSSSLWAEDQKPPESAKQMDDAHMKKHCEDMKQGKDMSEHNSKMTPAEHEAMMKKCREMEEQKDKDARNK